MTVDTTERDLKSDIYFPLPSTPDGQKKYRTNLEPGVINQHYGNVGDPLPEADFAYGIHKGYKIFFSKICKRFLSLYIFSRIVFYIGNIFAK